MMKAKLEQEYPHLIFFLEYRIHERVSGRLWRPRKLRGFNALKY